MPKNLKTVGFNVYCWGQQQQNRLLSDCLAPAAQRLENEGLLKRFWYDRMNSRGPHVFLLASVEADALPGVAADLTRRIGQYLEAHPSETMLTRAELQYLHDDMGGKVFCVADTREGLAENNTFECFEQEETQYPFSLVSGPAARPEVWNVIKDIYLWSLQSIRANRSGGLESLAAVFALRLNRTCLDEPALAADYWRYHAGTLLGGIDGIPLDEASLAGVLEKLVGAANLSLLRRYEQLLDSTPPERPAGPAATALAAADETADALRDLRRYVQNARQGDARRLPPGVKVILREILHTLFKQFGLRVPQHVPVVLFLWLAGLARAEAAVR